MNDSATTEIYTLSLHDALPIFNVLDFVSGSGGREYVRHQLAGCLAVKFRVLAPTDRFQAIDRKSTRLNSSHTVISYAVFCLKKKNNVDGRYRLSAIA